MAFALEAAKPDMAQKIVSGLHFRSRSLYGPGLGIELGAACLALRVPAARRGLSRAAASATLCP